MGCVNKAVVNTLLTPYQAQALINFWNGLVLYVCSCACMLHSILNMFITIYMFVIKYMYDLLNRCTWSMSWCFVWVTLRRESLCCVYLYASYSLPLFASEGLKWNALHGSSGGEYLKIIAQLPLVPPALFNFDSKQVNTLVYCVVPAERVLLSTNLTSEECAVYVTVMWKLDNLYKVHRNVIFECARGSIDPISKKENQPSSI